MCGIAGVFLKTGADEAFVADAMSRMETSIYHRGPDSYGAHIRPDRGFLNRRLAIVDQAGGEQPIYAAEGRAGIVYNGEVYNYEALREASEARGASFGTRTDTEAVLHAYLLDGPASFERLEGMFGLCIWDDRTGEVVLARDPFGMKPLYIYEDAHLVAFASEIRAILALPGLDLSLDADGIADYFTFRYTPAPRTIYKRIRRMAPGTYVELSPKGTGPERSFADLAALPPAEVPTDFEEAAAALRDMLSRSTKAHLIGEAPIALMLSGGVDSSVLAAILNSHGVTMEAFNIGFPEVNEFAYSSAVAQRHGFKLHNIEMTPEAVVASAEDILGALDEPVADPAQFPLYKLCAEIAKYATVVLSGEGADELFGGYPQYGSHARKRTWTHLLPEFLGASYYFLDNSAYLNRSPTWPETRRHFLGRTPLVAQSTYDFKTWVPDNLMMKADKIAMRHSLEGSLPLSHARMPGFRQGPA